MRLLHVSTYELKEFITFIPYYAILSHTWEDEEVTYQVMLHGVSLASQLKGFAKIRGCCRQAKADGFDWVWIDTCCIDKTSSMELSEAINSMYNWYRNAAVCYVYMADVPRFRFSDSRWFDRGWTLQELIAPRYVEFYSSDWLEIGTKTSLEWTIHSVTGIRIDILRGEAPSMCSVAERMSWASGRQTTRLEDEAYCLLGIFGVNMPLLYGEGTRAFHRLQEEILTQTEDMTLLAWSPEIPDQNDCLPLHTSVLAPSPYNFRRPDLYTHIPSTAFGFDDADSILFPETGYIEWEDIQNYQWKSGSESLPFDQFSFDPPLVTSRGISITLLVDTNDLDSRKSTTEPTDEIVLAWLYTDVVTHSPNSAVSGDTPQSPISRSMMVCIWLTLIDSGRTHPDVPVRAIRTPGRGPVSVPTIFRPRFQPKALYLQHSIEQRAFGTPYWSMTVVSDAGVSRPPTLSLVIRFAGNRSIHPVDVTSHYPPEAKLNPPLLASGLDGVLTHMPLRSFNLVLSGGFRIEAYGALRFSISGASPPEENQFVVIFGQAIDDDLVYCHVEYVIPSLATIVNDTRDFWAQFLSPAREMVSDVAEPPTDRSAALLPSGAVVSVMIKKKMNPRMPSFVPTLVVSIHDDGLAYLRAMGRLHHVGEDEEGYAEIMKE